MTLEVLANIPKLAGETGVFENGAHHLRRLRLPVALETIAIPELAQCPSGRYRHREPEIDMASLAPCRRFSLRPEEKNRGSRIADVVPESPRRHDEMDDAVSVVAAVRMDQFAVSEREIHRLGAFGRASRNACVEAQERRDGESIPRAVAPIDRIHGVHAERRGHRRERMGHPNVFRRRSERQCVVVHLEPSERPFNVLDRAGVRARDILEGRGRAGLAKVLVDEESNTPIQIFQMSPFRNAMLAPFTLIMTV